MIGKMTFCHRTKDFVPDMHICMKGVIVYCVKSDIPNSGKLGGKGWQLQLIVDSFYRLGLVSARPGELHKLSFVFPLHFRRSHFYTRMVDHRCMTLRVG